LQDAGWLPGQLFGLVNEERMAPQLTHGLEDHRQIELPSAVIRLHGARGGNRFQDTRLTIILGRGMRRTDREIESREEMDEIIRGSQVCRIALAMDNIPYIVPVSFGYDGESIYIHTAKEGKKIIYFKNNNNVCFEFERNVKLFIDPINACKWTFSYESVIGFGKIHELESFENRKNGLNKIMCQYSGKEWVFGEDKLDNIRVWKIGINSITGKRSIKLAT